jgi:hypothetical protein
MGSLSIAKGLEMSALRSPLSALRSRLTAFILRHPDQAEPFDLSTWAEVPTALDACWF